MGRRHYVWLYLLFHPINPASLLAKKLVNCFSKQCEIDDKYGGQWNWIDKSSVVTVRNIVVSQGNLSLTSYSMNPNPFEGMKAKNDNLHLSEVWMRHPLFVINVQINMILYTLA